MVHPVGPYEPLKGLLKNFCTGESFLKVPFSNLHIEMKHPEQISCLVKNGPSSGTIDPTLGAFLENLHERNFLRNGFPYIIHQVDQNLYVKPFGQKWSHKTLLEPGLLRTFGRPPKKFKKIWKKYIWKWSCKAIVSADNFCFESIPPASRGR